MGASIHMFFVFFPIAVIWLRKDGRVVDTVLARPFRPYYAPSGPAKYFIEGPPFLMESIKIGERLTFQPSGEEEGPEGI